MIDIKLLREQPEKIKEAIATKNADPKLVDDFLRLDEEWRGLTKTVDELRAKQNTLSKERKIEEAKENKAKLKESEEQQTTLAQKRDDVIRMIPNPPEDTAPVGKDESANATLREVGKKPNFSFPAKDYLSLAEHHEIIDVKRAAKVSGSRFGYLVGKAALLEFALIQFAIQKLAKKGFIPIIPPVIITIRFIWIGFFSELHNIV